jgi:hypothetical protein
MSEYHEVKKAIAKAIHDLRVSKATIFPTTVAILALDYLGLHDLQGVTHYGMLEFLKNLARRLIPRGLSIEDPDGGYQSDMFGDGLPDYANKAHGSGDEGGYIPRDEATREDVLWNMRKCYKLGDSYNKQGDAWMNYAISKWGDLVPADFEGDRDDRIFTQATFDLDDDDN